MAISNGDEFRLKLASDIVVAFLSHSAIAADDLPSLVMRVRASLEADRASLEADLEAPGASVRRQRPQRAKAAAGDALEDVANDSSAAPTTLDAQEPAVPIAQSVQRDYLVSLEDGKHYRSLRRHLMAKYGMTPDEYRAKWGLPSDYPMVAPSYAEERSEVAKRTRLGHSRKSKTEDAPSHSRRKPFP